VTVAFKEQLQRVAIALIIINDKDAGQIRHKHLELFSLANHLCEEQSDKHILGR
jgi:hypothetical protein